MNHRRCFPASVAPCANGWRTLTFRSLLLAAFALVVSLQAALAAPFASMVMDARTGEVLEAENADTRLHPASLTKMMTLYVAFEAIKRGEISLDAMVTVSAKAANEQPSRLGLKKGQRIQLRYLIRAAAIKSANDAATAIAEAISGSEEAFAARMTRTARALGMKHTTFRNAHGLTQPGHLSTARDMTILGRHLIYDYPQYYNLFSRQSAHVGIGTVVSHNRLLQSYEGADGIKTGYTAAAGFNLVASARRGDVRIIATVFGGTSTAARNARVAELLDLGFARAPKDARSKPPEPPAAIGDPPALVAAAEAPEDAPDGAAKTIRLSGAVSRSPRPHWRPDAAVPPAMAPETAPAPQPDAALIAAIEDGVAEALEEIADPAVGGAGAGAGSAPVLSYNAPPRPDRKSEAQKLIAQPADAALLAALDVPGGGPGLPAAPGDAPPAGDGAAPALALAAAPAALPPPPRPESGPVPDAPDAALAVADAAAAAAAGAPQPETLAAADPARIADVSPVRFQPPGEAAAEADGDGPDLGPQRDAGEGPVFLAAVPAATDPPPAARPLELAAIAPETFDDAPAEPEVVTRLSTSGGRHWGVSIGSFGSQYEAERVLLTTALKEVHTLGPALRKVARTPHGFEANFVGMTEDMARLACGRLSARAIACSTFGPGG